MENFMGSTIKGTKIKIIGVGGAGGNIVNNLIGYNIDGVEYAVVNTDEQDLNKSNASEKLSLGHLGAGGNPEVSKKAAEEKKREIEDLVKGYDMIFITAGMGGGTGTGAAPLIAKASREAGILTVAVVTKPFIYEGIRRKNNAEEGIKNLKEFVDTLIVIPNQKLADLPDADNISIIERFHRSNDILRYAITGISDLITKQGYINVDFADVKSVMSKSGEALFGLGEQLDENDTYAALVNRTITNPLLERSIKGAKNILVNVTMDETTGARAYDEILSEITKQTSGNEGGVVNVISGLILEKNVEKIKVTVIATEFEDEQVEEDLRQNLYSQKAYNNEKNDMDLDLVPEF